MIYGGLASGKLAPVERMMRVDEALTASPKAYLDLYEYLQTTGLRMEPTELLLIGDPNDAVADITVTLMGDPAESRETLTLMMFAKHRMSIKRIWKTGTTATSIYIFGIAV